MKKVTALVLALAMLLALAACSGGTDTQSPDDADQGSTQQTDDTQQPEDTGDGETLDTLIIAINAEFQTLDTATSTTSADDIIMHEIYDGLVKKKPDPDGSPQPWVAESWEISDDGLTYTFKIRDDVYFHDGTKMTVDDLVFSAEHVKNAPARASDHGTYMDYAEAIDENTFAIHLKTPYAPYLSMCLDSYFPIHSRAYWEKLEEQAAAEGTTAEALFADAPMGTGPYKVTERVPAESITLEVNEQHFALKPEIPKVIGKIISDPSTVSVAVETGEVHLAGHGSEVPSASLPLLEENENLTVQYVDTNNTCFVAFNTELAPFDNRELRQAINYAIDKQFVVDVVEEGHGTIANTIAAPSVIGYPADLEGYPYNVEQAKAKLAEAGYPDGQGLDTFTILCTDGKPKLACEAIQSQLAQIGINVEIQIAEKNAYLDDLMGGNFQLGYVNASVGNHSALYAQFLTAANIGALNISRINNPSIDEIFARADVITDETESNALYHQVYEIAEEEAYYAVLYWPQTSLVFTNKIQMGGMHGSMPYIHEITLVK